MAHLTEEDVLRFKSYYSMCPKPLRYKDIKELAEIIKVPRHSGIAVYYKDLHRYIATQAILFNRGKSNNLNGQLFNELYIFIVTNE